MASIKSFKSTIPKKLECISLNSTQLKSQLNLEKFNPTKIESRLNCLGLKIHWVDFCNLPI